MLCFFRYTLAFIPSSFLFAATARGGAVPFSTRRKAPKTRGGPRPLDPGAVLPFPRRPLLPRRLAGLCP